MALKRSKSSIFDGSLMPQLFEGFCIDYNKSLNHRGFDYIIQLKLRNIFYQFQPPGSSYRPQLQLRTNEIKVFLLQVFCKL
uniref:Uncharacterized protein n=1 Tax=Brassica oleracea TaxID=3712 RepID=A0A3P6EFI9_BRAOL|nr:unnamed protein product [Brassica oleracea]